ncbi:methyl-accepting chemotaxis protein [Desulfovibrio litoralis]|uniref:Methyl-accepting chemotaxis protein (MCP) signalling domain-containing protein n=1 Tax=Desulfovibrio litoralis DSM 11393 TaxID=1121455 RepID=A0A1M7SG37_9BACT|nr:methyl-accepting chemotaxis protein [Desulfovibrio litoralis]SHN57427.1 Methyl-accepting chemotaxis protein (MCP) signalling domain-containing protein [Desulfovibrio litoralis DSM 11393]
MTMKHKIIVGCVFLIFIIIAISFIGTRALNKSSDGLIEFGRLASVSQTLYDIDGDFYVIGYNVYRFLDHQDAKFISAAIARTDSLKDKISIVLKVAQRSESVNSLKQLEANVSVVHSNLSEINRLSTVTSTHYNEQILPALRELTLQTTKTSMFAFDAIEFDVLSQYSKLADPFGELRGALARFYVALSPELVSEVNKHMEEVKQILTEALSLTQDNAIKQEIEIDLNSLDLFRVHFLEMENNAINQRVALTSLNDIMQQSFVAVGSISQAQLDIKNTFENDLRTSNEDSQRLALSLGIIGVIVGIGFATLIIYNLVKVLKDVSRFANDISMGNFSSIINVKEKGEIGSVIDAMQEISGVVKNMTGQVIALTDLIAAGAFRDRLKADQFKGGFGEIANDINTLCDTYVSALDSISVGLMTGNSKCEFKFLNKAAQSFAGGNKVGDPCKEHFNTPACDKNCLGMKAMGSTTPITGETVLRPALGKPIDVAVTAISLYDKHKEVVGFMEILVDITDIKTQQKMIEQAAIDASEIASRVAAAAEELSAQVEEVSRGTEMQRRRMETTAGAMAEMNSTVLDVARSAGEAAEQTNNTRNEAREGAELVNRVIGSIKSINQVTHTLHSNMQSLGKQAENIGGVLNVISDIADQTNLLALNAAIEAARAGEAGRGFAVVADEVRKLAEKTMQATKEVESSITAIQHSTKTNINEVTSAVSSIEEATGLAQSSGDALTRIVDLAAINSNLVTSIATAAEEQSATSEEINRSVDEVSVVVTQTSNGMIQATAAIQDLSATAQELNRVMADLKKQNK